MNEIIVVVHELNARLSEYLREAKSGKVITITEHGKSIRQIIPGEQSVERRLQGLLEAGLILWRGKIVTPQAPVVVNVNEKQVSDILVEMRG